MADKELAVLVVHGMGSQEPGFAKELCDELGERLGDAAERVAWKEVYWQDVLEPRELAYFDRARRAPNELDYTKLRRFVLTALGDAVAYQQVGSRHNTAYRDIHARVEERLAELHEEVGLRTVPLVVVAHSLGAHIMSNYIWDLQHGGGADRSTFERMRSLAGLVTFGCNIPLFGFAYEKVVPIKFPGPRLSPALKRKARWLNFYDPDDVLGYPLKPINAAYRKVVSRDIPINVGGVLSAWNPASHGKYWTDNDLTKPVARFLGTLLA